MGETRAAGYLEVQVLTASKDELLLMLLDGAVRFVEGARDRLAGGDREGKNHQLQRAQTIVLELVQSLSPAVGEKVYGNLIGLYKFIYRRLVEANVRDDARSLEEGLKILHDVREMWRQAVAAYRGGRASPSPSPLPEQGLSVQA